MRHLSCGESTPQKGLLWRNRVPCSAGSSRTLRISVHGWVKILLQVSKSFEGADKRHFPHSSRACVTAACNGSASIRRTTSSAKTLLRSSIVRCETMAKVYASQVPKSIPNRISHQKDALSPLPARRQPAGLARGVGDHPLSLPLRGGSPFASISVHTFTPVPSSAQPLAPNTCPLSPPYLHRPSTRRQQPYHLPPSTSHLSFPAQPIARPPGASTPTTYHLTPATFPRRQQPRTKHHEPRTKNIPSRPSRSNSPISGHSRSFAVPDLYPRAFFRPSTWRQHPYHLPPATCHLLPRQQRRTRNQEQG